MKFIPSRSGGKLLMVSGYTYRKNNGHQKTTAWWRCSSYQALKCPASAVTKNFGLHKLMQEHNHDPPKFVKTPFSLMFWSLCYLLNECSLIYLIIYFIYRYFRVLLCKLGICRFSQWYVILFKIFRLWPYFYNKHFFNIMNSEKFFFYQMWFYE